MVYVAANNVFVNEAKSTYFDIFASTKQPAQISSSGALLSNENSTLLWEAD